MIEFDLGSGLKWTVFGQGGRFRGLNWTVQNTQSGRSAKLDGLRNWTVLKSKSGRLEKVDGLEEENKTVMRDESRRSKRLEVNDLKD